MPHNRSGLPFPVRLSEVMLQAVMPVKLCCPLRSAWISGYVNANGFSPALLSVSATTSFGLASPGTGFSNAELIQLNILVFAPIPSASVRIAITANPGAFKIIRKLYRKSCQIELIRAPPTPRHAHSLHGLAFTCKTRRLVACDACSSHVTPTHRVSLLLPS